GWWARMSLSQGNPLDRGRQGTVLVAARVNALQSRNGGGKRRGWEALGVQGGGGRDPLGGWPPATSWRTILRETTLSAACPAFAAGAAKDNALPGTGRERRADPHHFTEDRPP